MTYQPIRINGSDVTTGERECSERYEIVRDFCKSYKRPLTVLDIGAAQAYMGIRLCEDFPDCTVVGLEEGLINPDHPEIDPVLPSRLIWLHHKFSLDDLRQIASCEHFDVVLALSVIHHFEGTFSERLEVFRSLGDNLILELAWEDNACGGEQKKYEIPQDTFVLGEGASHLVEGAKRKILLMPQMKTSIAKSYVGGGDISLTIYSDFLLKSVKFRSKPEVRIWHRGLNLKTATTYGMVWPTRARIVELLEDQREYVIASGHLDCVPHNVILSGDEVTFIDSDGPMSDVYPVEEYFDKLIAEVGR